MIKSLEIKIKLKKSKNYKLGKESIIILNFILLIDILNLYDNIVFMGQSWDSYFEK